VPVVLALIQDPPKRISGLKSAPAVTPSLPGQQKIVDSGGRVDRFRRKYGLSEYVLYFFFFFLVGIWFSFWGRLPYPLAAKIGYLPQGGKEIFYSSFFTAHGALGDKVGLG